MIDESELNRAEVAHQRGKSDDPFSVVPILGLLGVPVVLLALWLIQLSS